MATVFPFAALRPKTELAAEVAAVPYDVVNRDEARALAQGKPHSFLHVTKPEIDLDDNVDPYGEAVYAQGRRALQRMIDEKILVADAKPCFYLYALTMRFPEGEHTQTGIVLCASVDEYERGIVKKHEHTRPDKENDRVQHMLALDAQSGVVFLVHEPETRIDQVVAATEKRPPAYDFVAADGVRHRFWVIDAPSDIAALTAGFAATGPLYIADGHHRSAAAARVAAEKRKAGNKDGAHERFVAVSFAKTAVRILPYNRVVKDFFGKSPGQFLNAVRERFEVSEGKPANIAPRTFAMYMGGRWYSLRAKVGSFDDNDPVRRLDVSILQEQLLAPLLGIEDPRRDKRIDFVGGIRGHDELEKRVRDGWAVAFALHPTGIDDLFAIANAGEVMPPKSTWFEPKLRDGLVVHRL